MLNNQSYDEYFRTGTKMKSFETSSVYDFLWSKDELEKKEVKSKVFTVKQQYVVFRAVGRSENPSGGHNLPSTGTCLRSDKI